MGKSLLNNIQSKSASNKAAENLFQAGKSFNSNVQQDIISEDIPQTFEEVESQLKKLTGKTWQIYWHIGKRLAFIRVNFLSDLGYSNISEYAKERFGFSHTNTMNFIRISESFPLSYVRNFGSKLRLLLPLDDTKKQKYLEWMEEKKPSFQEIEEKIKSENKKPGRPKKDISLTNFSLSVNLKQMGFQIKEDQSDIFVKDLIKLISKYSL